VFKEESAADPETESRAEEATASSAAVAAEDIQGMSMNALRAQWRRLYRSPPPRHVRRDLLVRAVVWKYQDVASGTRSTPTLRRLKKLAEQLETHGNLAEPRSPTLRPGSRLLREWGGATHTVTVIENGFEWQGSRYRSLSEIACAITGTHWSGPRFFGLKDRRPRAETTESGDE